MASDADFPTERGVDLLLRRPSAQQPDGEVERLLPCPFCGSTNIDPEEWSSLDSRGPGCRSCGALADTNEAWNRRVPIPPASPEREAEAVIDQLDKLVRDGIGAVEFCLTENGHIGIWIERRSDEESAMATGDTAAECIEAVIAARKEFSNAR